ncbi:MAG: hypothetical protein WCP85_11965 [Mariniphaga sp.]
MNDKQSGTLNWVQPVIQYVGFVDNTLNPYQGSGASSVIATPHFIWGYASASLSNLSR